MPSPAGVDDRGTGAGALLARARASLRRLAALHDAVFLARWRTGLQREARDQEDLLVTLVFIEALGVENPASYHTLELYPELVEAFHDWHRRQGLERSPEPGVCC